MMHILMSGDGRLRMRTTITLDDDLLERAEQLPGSRSDPLWCAKRSRRLLSERVPSGWRA